MEPWKRNLYVSWIIQILSLTGFGIVLPFLPFYIQELGVTDAAELKIWVGIMSSAPALAMGVMAPVWGLLSDRFGRRIMLLRAMGFGVLVLAGLAFAKSVQAVLVLRLAQGMFTGTVAASATLIAAGTPRERLSYALGFLSSSTFIGFSLGPLVGGILVELVGYRATFLVAAGILVVGFVLVLAFIREAESHHTEAQQGSPSFSSRSILTLSFVSLFLLLFCLRFSRSVAMPFLPLVVQAARGTLEGTPVVVGAISAATGLVTAVSGITLARLGDRWDKRGLMTVLLGIGCLVSSPLFFARNLAVLIGPYVATAFFLGSVEPLLQSQISAQTPPEKRGTVIGILGLVGSGGWALAPMAGSGISVRFSTNHVFLTYTLFLGLTAAVSLVLWRRVRATVGGGI